ncbi:cupin domain-containing protein [Spongorhabdus nitratireducens]
MDVGTRLKALRIKHNLSQRELAKRAGVTNSTISMIEKNNVSPSVSSLKKVLDGIPISMVDFFSMEVEETSQVIYSREDMIDVGASGITMNLVGKSFPNRAMSFLEEIYEPGAGTGEELLKHDGEEAGIVLEGQIEITINGEVYRLSAGESYYFESTRPHRFHNASSESCRLISCTTPAGF